MRQVITLNSSLNWGEKPLTSRLSQVLVVVFYALSATFNYTALWVRLRIFFNHPVMKHLGSIIVNCLIWFALVAIVGSSLLNTLIFALTVSAVDTEYGCSLGETTSVSPTVRYVVLTISSVGAQVLLLSLFLYPLMKHRASVKKTLRAAGSSTSAPPGGEGGIRSMNGNTLRKAGGSHMTAAANPNLRRIRSSARTESDSDTTCGGKSKSDRNRKFLSFRKQKQANREKKLLRIMRRVMVMAIVCALSDIITAVVTIAFNNHPRVTSNLFFNANLLINIISVLLSFGDWQERLFPCCAKRLRAKSKSRLASASSVGSRTPHAPVGERSNGGRATPHDAGFFHMQQPQDSTESQMVATPSQAPDDDVFTFDHGSSV